MPAIASRTVIFSGEIPFKNRGVIGVLACKSK
jgi:hypothetical protein